MQNIFINIKTFLEEPWLNSACLIIGGLWALFLFRSSNKRERDNNELLNQPKFKFFDSMNTHNEIKRSCDTPESQMRPLPDCCDNPECDRIHWFDIKNDGNFPADGITISIALEGENNFKTKIEERRMGVKHLQAQESLQFSTSLIAFRIHFTKKGKTVIISGFMFSSNTDRGIQNIGISEYTKLTQIKYLEIIFQRYALVRGMRKALGRAEWSSLE